MSLPKCAFIMTTHNGYSKGPERGKWLDESLRSLLRQDYKGEFLVVVNDDGSTDGTEGYARFVLRSNDVVIRSDENLGISTGYNRAAGIALSNGAEWLFFQTDDDVSESNRLSATMQYLEVWRSLGYDPDLMCGWFAWIDSKGNIRSEKAGRETRPDMLRVLLQRSPTSEAGAAFCAFSAKSWKELGGFSERLKYAADIEIIYRAIEKGYTIAGTPRVLYRYRTKEFGNHYNVSHIHLEEHLKEFEKVKDEFLRRTNPFYHEMHASGLKFANKEGRNNVRETAAS